MSKRHKTKYPGVFYREAKRLAGNGTEKIYYVVFKKDGKVIEEKAGRQYADDMTPAKASTYRAERITEHRPSPKQIRAQREAEAEAERNRWTIKKLWEEYKTCRPDLKGLTTDENRFKKHLTKKFGNKEPGEITLLEIDHFRVLAMQEKRPATVKNILELLRRIINFGVDRQLCEQPPFRIKLPKVDNIKTETLTPDQLTRLLETLDNAENVQAANMMKLALYSGMRRGELFRLEWSDIDFTTNFIHLRTPKGGREQKVPLSKPARKLLLNHPREDSPYVFPGKDGGQRTDIKKAVNTIKEAAGLPKDFRALHGLRHAYASMLASSGRVDLYTLQKLLTHESPAMTQRYAHLHDEALTRAAETAGELFSFKN